MYLRLLLNEIVRPRDASANLAYGDVSGKQKAPASVDERSNALSFLSWILWTVVFSRYNHQWYFNVFFKQALILLFRLLCATLAALPMTLLFAKFCATSLLRKAFGSAVLSCFILPAAPLHQLVLFLAHQCKGVKLDTCACAKLWSTTEARNKQCTITNSQT